MGLPDDYPFSPYDVIAPDKRWRPDVNDPLQEALPPLVEGLRERVCQWRQQDYEGASETSYTLLHWWFCRDDVPYPALKDDEEYDIPFPYYFAQQEAIETIIYLYDVERVKDKFGLLRFDKAGVISGNMFHEDWRRVVIKMATGTGKTKVMAMVMVWSYFHRLYEEESDMARNFLVIAPNIIVLDRLVADFKGGRIFSEDGMIPSPYYDPPTKRVTELRLWTQDWRMKTHVQKQAHSVTSYGNLFLTNIHHVYVEQDKEPTQDDETIFLGKKPPTSLVASKIDLRDVVQGMDELVILNDEAHHIHDVKLQWFKSIESLHKNLTRKGHGIALQVDMTATPKDEKGKTFAHVITDYPLVEAVAQNVVKHPVIPDKESVRKLLTYNSLNYGECYRDYLHLGVTEWRRAFEEHQQKGKKAILFVMTDDTKHCDDVADYLEKTYEELEGAVLVIHTNRAGQIGGSGQSKKEKEELDRLRRQARTIDDNDNPYRAIVSVLMLREGWDVSNVTTIVGLRAFSAKSGILPEQTLGRGLRKIYPPKDTALYTHTPERRQMTGEEALSAIGTEEFITFVEKIEKEGVELRRVAMGEGVTRDAPEPPFTIELDRHKMAEPSVRETLDIHLPLLSRRYGIDHSLIGTLTAAMFPKGNMDYKVFPVDAPRIITFNYMVQGLHDEGDEEEHHSINLDNPDDVDYRKVLRYFAHKIARQMKLTAHYQAVYGLLRDFIKTRLFKQDVPLEDVRTLRNLAEDATRSVLIETMTSTLARYLVSPVPHTPKRIGTIELSGMTPFRPPPQKFIIPKKSLLNRITGDGEFELAFAEHLDTCPDVVSYAKNYRALRFSLDYMDNHKRLRHYSPDFLVKTTSQTIYIIETKGREDIDVPHKMHRLHTWCVDATILAQKARDKSKETKETHEKKHDITMYDFLYVPQTGFEKHKPQSIADMATIFTEYKEGMKTNATP